MCLNLRQNTEKEAGTGPFNYKFKLDMLTFENVFQLKGQKIVWLQDGQRFWKFWYPEGFCIL